MFKVKKKATNMKRQRGGGINLFLNVSTVDFEEHIFLLNYYYKTINMFRKIVKTKLEYKRRKKNNYKNKLNCS